jgi:signal transduction histidine kinase
MQTMAPGGPGTTLPRFGRRLLVAGLLIGLAEILCCGLPLVWWMGDSSWERLWLRLALPLLLAVWAAAELRLAALVRPLLDVVATLREGGKPKPDELEVARQGLSRAPREAGLVHLLAWMVVAVALPAGTLGWGQRDPRSAAALLQLVLVAAAGMAAIRSLAIEAILGPTRAIVMPNLQGIRVFAEQYRGALLAVGIALLGLWQTGLAYFASTLAWATGAMLTSGTFVILPILIAGAVWWWRVARARTRPVDEYFDLALRAKSGKGPARDDPRGVAAFVAAQRAPYSLAVVQSVTLVIGGAVAVAYLAATGLAGRVMAGRLLLIVLLVSLLATLYQTLFIQQVLRPLIRHLGSRHALPPREVRAPLGLRTKLGGSLLAVLVAGCAFVWLFVHAHSPSGRWSLAVAMAAIVGVIVLLVRDVVSPLQALEERSLEMANGQLARPVPPWGEADEIGRLAVMFEEMRRSLRDRLRSTESINVDLEREVRRRTEALEQRNAELHEALEKLRRAQDTLVRSEKLASMGRLVAGIAHEINNPVNAVINSLGPLDEIVKRIAAGEGEAAPTMAKEAEEILAVVQRGASRTKAIVQALHGYARGDDSIQREVSLARSVDDTLGLLQHRLRHVKVAKEIESSARIIGFAGQVDQVLMNLLTNAAQAIGEKGGTIRIQARNLDDRVSLVIADDGPGIPPEVLPRIFDPFFTTKDVGEGSGLGLSIVHGIIERHGGHIDVDSQPGQGTKFSISFPLPPASAVRGHPQPV